MRVLSIWQVLLGIATSAIVLAILGTLISAAIGFIAYLLFGDATHRRLFGFVGQAIKWSIFSAWILGALGVVLTYLAAYGFTLPTGDGWHATIVLLFIPILTGTIGAMIGAIAGLFMKPKVISKLRNSKPAIALLAITHYPS